MDNYTGPYWSDGKLQSSVEFGQTPPTSALDAESRLHDSAYAHYQDLAHRMAADAIYDARVEKLGGLGTLAGTAVAYGNQALRSGKNLIDYSEYGLVGLIVGSLINDYNLNDYMMNVDKYKKEVLAYYATDPGWAGRGETPTTDEPRVTRRKYAEKASDPGPKAESVIDPAKRPTVYPHNQYDHDNQEASSYEYNPYPVYYRRGGRRRKKSVKYE
jgi:hypothetical protein